MIASRLHTFSGGVGVFTDFRDDLRKMMRSWGWDDFTVRDMLPRLVRILTGVGILVEVDGVCMATEKSSDDELWNTAMHLLEEEEKGTQTSS